MASSHKQKMQLEEIMIDNCDTSLAKLSGLNRRGCSAERATVEGQGERSMTVDSASPQIAPNLENAKNTLANSRKRLWRLHKNMERASTMTAAAVQQTHEQVDAVKFKNSKQKKQSRKEYLHNRHQVTKIRGYLTTHSVPSRFRMCSLRTFCT